jgi:hypothetical protein
VPGSSALELTARALALLELIEKLAIRQQTLANQDREQRSEHPLPLLRIPGSLASVDASSRCAEGSNQITDGGIGRFSGTPCFPGGSGQRERRPVEQGDGTGHP